MIEFLIGTILILFFYFFEIFRPFKVVKFISVSLSVLFFYILLFNVTYNTDWWAYQSGFEGVINIDDILFNIISDFFRNKGYDYFAVYKTQIAIMTVAFVYFASRFKSSNTFAISSIYLIFMLMQFSNQAPYFVAFSLYLVSLYSFIIQKSRLKFIILAFFSIISHFGIIPLYLFLVYYYIIKDKNLINISVLTALIAPVVVLILNMLIPSLFGGYTAYFETGVMSSLLGGVYSNLIWFAWIFLIYQRNIKISKQHSEYNYDTKYKFLYKLSIFPSIFITIAIFLKIISSRYIAVYMLVWIAYYLYSSRYIYSTLHGRINDLTKLILYALVSFIYIYFIPLFIFGESEIMRKVIEILESNSSMSFLW